MIAVLTRILGIICTVILYMMLLGRHPFDLDCDASDEEIGVRIKEQQLPSFDITRHLSSSAMDLLR